MFNFFKKNDRTDNLGKTVIDPDSYARILNRISERDEQLSAIKAKLSFLELELQSLRNKMSKKLRDLSEEYKQEHGKEKDINDDLVYLG